MKTLTAKQHAKRVAIRWAAGGVIGATLLYFIGLDRKILVGVVLLHAASVALLWLLVAKFAERWPPQSQIKKEPIQPPQRNAGSRPSSGDSSASETPSSLGPRG